MSNLVAAAVATSTTTDSRIGFLTEGGGSWAKWDRFLTLDGNKAYHIGNVCDTCSFFFERLHGANQKVSVNELATQFRRGLSCLSEEVLNKVSAALPAGDYRALLLRCVPRRVLPAKQGDYFFEEQVTLWGIDPFWGLPHYTRTEYYRTDVVPLGDQRALFEFIVPMFPPTNYLNTVVVGEYKAVLAAGAAPTALAVSILDIKQPADWAGDPAITEHWCLSHYLLDGHHKVFAASETGRPITILSFLAAGEGVSSPDQVKQLMAWFERVSE